MSVYELHCGCSSLFVSIITCGCLTHHTPANAHTRIVTPQCTAAHNKQQDHIILLQMIDEVHTLIGAGAAEGAIDAANILKPALARGELQCMGATTLDEYRKHIEKDPALERRFQPVRVNEPTVDETYQILGGAPVFPTAVHTIVCSVAVLRFGVLG